MAFTFNTEDRVEFVGFGFTERLKDNAGRRGPEERSPTHVRFSFDEWEARVTIWMTEDQAREIAERILLDLELQVEDDQ